MPSITETTKTERDLPLYAMVTVATISLALVGTHWSTDPDAVDLGMWYWPVGLTAFIAALGVFLRLWTVEDR